MEIANSQFFLSAKLQIRQNGESMRSFDEVVGDLQSVISTFEGKIDGTEILKFLDEMYQTPKKFYAGVSEK